MNACILSCITAAFALLIATLEAQTSETDEHLAKALERFPEADANKDGILTGAEADAFRRKRAPKQPKVRGPEPAMKRYSAAELAERYEACRFKGVRYRFLEPPGFEKGSGVTYPLILSLHGAGGKGDDNLKNLTGWNGVLADPSFQEKHPCFVVVPQSNGPWRVPGPLPDMSDDAIAQFPEIWRTVFTKRRGLGAPDPASGNLDKVFELLDSLAASYPIDLDRVYVLGHSMGGFGSWTAIAEAPHRFAAAIPCAGGLSPWHDMKTIAHIPVWAFHGDEDTTVSPELSRVVFEQMKSLDGNMKFTAFKGVGHGANGFAFVYTGDEPEKGFITRYSSDRCDRTPGVWEWLFAQRRGGAR